MRRKRSAKSAVQKLWQQQRCVIALKRRGMWLAASSSRANACIKQYCSLRAAMFFIPPNHVSEVYMGIDYVRIGVTTAQLPGA